MEGTLQYLRGLQSRLEDGGADGEELTILVENAFHEIDGMEFRLSCHHDGSVYLERLLKLASNFQVRVFWDRLAGCFVRMACNRYSSHVLETLLIRSEQLIDSHESSDASEEFGVLLGIDKMIERIEEEMKSQLEELTNNTYASHVLRVFIERKFPVSDGFLKTTCSQFETLWKSQTGAPVLQCLLIKYPEQVQELSFTKSFFLRAAQDKIGSRTCESFLESSGRYSGEFFASFYQTNLRGELPGLSSDQCGNFVVQSLIANCPSESLFLVFLDELRGCADQIAKGKMGILFRILDWSVRRGKAFEAATQYFFNCFHAKTPSEKQSIVKVIIEQILGKSILALFAKIPAEQNRFVVEGFLDLSAEDLRGLSTDKTGAHTVEAFISPSGTIGAKARNKIIRKLIPFAADLAVDASGSFVIETAFMASNLEAKTAIATELGKSRKRLEESKAGKIILRKCKIEDFERRQEEWKRERAASDKKHSILDEIVFEQPKRKK